MLSSCLQQQKTQFIDIRSDTVSRAPLEMLKVMSKAQTGDDVFDDDPTANHFQQVMAKLFHKQSSLFMPSTTMSNLTAILHWTKPSDQVIVWAYSHLINRQTTSFATIGGVQTRQIFNQSGILDVAQIKQKTRSSYSHITFPSTTLIFIENPTFFGKVWPLDKLKQLYEYAKSQNIKVHIDGARIFNAIQFYKQKNPLFQIKDMSQYCDSISLCLSKGLCVPVGSMLVSNKQAVSKCKWIRKSLGGGMRQIGILASGGLWALQNVVPGLKEDHQVAKLLAQQLKKLSQIQIISEVQINMVLFKISSNTKMKRNQFSENSNHFDHKLFQKYLKQEHKIKIRPYNEDSGFYRFMIYRQIREKQIKCIVNGIKQFMEKECSLE